MIVHTTASKTAELGHPVRAEIDSQDNYPYIGHVTSTPQVGATVEVPVGGEVAPESLCTREKYTFSE